MKEYICALITLIVLLPIIIATLALALVLSPVLALAAPVFSRICAEYEEEKVENEQ